jgi:signal transduction histidine kinase
LEHLFDRFFRTEAATAGAMPGTGLGLSISKAIVELHGGDIRTESVEGAGTCFFVSLPGPCRFERPAEHALAS